MRKVSIETEAGIVRLYKALVKPARIKELLFVTSSTISNVIKRNNVVPVWYGPGRRDLKEFRCTKCEKIKPLSEFTRNSESRFGNKVTRCRACNRIDLQSNRSVNIEKRRKYNRERARHLRRTSPQFKLADNFKRRINTALVGGFGPVGTAAVENLIGCSVSCFKSHLQSLFKAGMSWDNHGREGWHIDHKIPVGRFDLTLLEQQKACNHWSNFQPLWAFENRSKGNRNAIVSPNK